MLWGSIDLPMDKKGITIRDYFGALGLGIGIATIVCSIVIFAIYTAIGPVADLTLPLAKFSIVAGMAALLFTAKG